MDLFSGNPFWPTVNTKRIYRPPLTKDITTEVVIVGAGISGALIAYYLAKTGINCVLVDRRAVGAGSTSATTALVQYELDKNLWELIDIMGEKNALKAYRLSLSAIKKLHRLSKAIGSHSKFEHKKSLYLASAGSDLRKIEKEYKARSQHGFSVNLLEQKDLANYGVKAAGALLSAESGQIDPLDFTLRLVSHGLDYGLKVFSKTDIVRYFPGKNGVSLVTADNFVIKAQKAVIATGYESQNFNLSMKTKFTTDYALVTKPMTKEAMGCLGLYTAWETAADYLYVSTTDNRIMVGLSGVKFDSPQKRQLLLDIKIKEMEERFHQYFPGVKIEPEYSWAGTFVQSEDSLPYIGQNNNYPNFYFSFGYGGNGIAFGVIGADIIRDKILGKRAAGTEIFSFDRYNMPKGTLNS